MDAVAVIIVVAVVVVCARSSIRSIQSDWMDPAVKGLRFQEKRRLAKLARSQQPITDPELSGKAERYARWMTWANNKAMSPRHLLLLAVPVIVTATLSKRNNWRIAMEIGLVVLLIIILLWRRRLSAEVERTAQLNGWNLDTDSS